MSSIMEQRGCDRAGAILFAGTAVDVLVPAEETTGAFSLLRIANPAGCWTPPHLHRNEDETVFVLSGTLRVETEERAMDVGPGQAIVLPRGRPHRLGNPGAQEAHFLVLCTPGGFDAFVRAAGRPMPDNGPAMDEADIARLIQAAPCHGIELLAPGTLRPVATEDAAAPAAFSEIDALGTCIQVLAEFGPAEDDLCLMRERVPPGCTVPMNTHAGHEVLYGRGGVLDVCVGAVREAARRVVGAGQVMNIPAGVQRALINRGDVPADIVLITQRRVAEQFLKIGRLL
jgi:quercetin dioxygenase-like cupin family protein